jgi:hypothetical protein
MIAGEVLTPTGDGVSWATEGSPADSVSDTSAGGADDGDDLASEVSESAESSLDSDDDPGCKIGEAHQAVIPEWGGGSGPSTSASASRGDVLVWSPSDEEGVESFLSAASALGHLAAQGQRKVGALATVEMALSTWHMHGKRGKEWSLARLEEAVRADEAARLNAAEVDALGHILREVGNNFLHIPRALAPTMKKALSRMVEAYYLHHCHPLGFAADDALYRPMNARPKRATARPRAPSRTPSAVGKRHNVVLDAVPASLLDMLRAGLIAPGDGVLSTTTVLGDDIHADLLPGGSIRYRKGDAEQLFRSPAIFARAVTVCLACQSPQHFADGPGVDWCFSSTHRAHFERLSTPPSRLSNCRVPATMPSGWCATTESA